MNEMPIRPVELPGQTKAATCWPSPSLRMAAEVPAEVPEGPC